MKIKATVIADNTSYVRTNDATGIHPDDMAGEITTAIEDAMLAANQAGHEELTDYTITVSFSRDPEPVADDEPTDEA